MRPSDLFQRVTQQIIAAIETGAEDFVMPWHRWGESMGSPINAVTRRPYRGINKLLLWIAAELDGHCSGRWATYRQWTAGGAQVRKGEKATAIVFWKSAANDTENGDKSGDQLPFGSRVIGRVYHVFNADQVDGVEKSLGGSPTLNENERIIAAETFFEACNAKLEHGGDRAFYIPSQDKIQMPRFEQFRDPASYYSVLAHEHVHWTGAEHRLNRNLSGGFGTDAYAFEELVAELGSAFIAAHLSLSVEPRPDHAAYISSWLRVMRADSRALLTAAAKAQEALDYTCHFNSKGNNELEGRPEQVAS